MEEKKTAKDILAETTASRPAYWLMKSEPDAYSIDDLKQEKKSYWDGIRNYQARNFMMNHMQVGDKVLFYHSSTQPPGVVGLARVCGAAIPDHTALDKKAKYFDPKHTEEKPRWFMVEVKFEKKFKQIVTLEDMKAHPRLQGMLVAQRGQRLSIQPCLEHEYQVISELGLS